MDYEKELGRPLTDNDLKLLEDNDKFSKTFYAGIADKHKDYLESVNDAYNKAVANSKEILESKQRAYEAAMRKIEEEEIIKLLASIKEREKVTKEEYSLERDRLSEVALLIKGLEARKAKAMRDIERSSDKYREWESKSVGSIHPDRKSWLASEPERLTVSDYDVSTWERKERGV